jgi:protein CpxP
MKILLTGTTALAVTLAIAGGSAAQMAAPSATPDAPPNSAMKSPDDMSTTTLAKGHNSFTKSEALHRIQKAGYGSVTALALDSDGIWQADATRAGQPVKVGLDYKGNVVAQ